MLSALGFIPSTTKKEERKEKEESLRPFREEKNSSQIATQKFHLSFQPLDSKLQHQLLSELPASWPALWTSDLPVPAIAT
jgi:hypothetical protein